MRANRNVACVIAVEPVPVLRALAAAVVEDCGGRTALDCIHGGHGTIVEGCAVAPTARVFFNLRNHQNKGNLSEHYRLLHIKMSNMSYLKDNDSRRHDCISLAMGAMSDIIRLSVAVLGSVSGITLSWNRSCNVSDHDHTPPCMLHGDCYF